MMSRGFLKLKKGIVGNIHPLLSFLDSTTVPFQGWFELDEKFFYIEYGIINNGRHEKAILSKSVERIVDDFKRYGG